MAKKLPNLPRVHSLRELKNLAATDLRYRALLLVAAKNLGGSFKEGDVEAAYRWLETNALETDEKGVVGEVNFCRSLV